MLNGLSHPGALFEGKSDRCMDGWSLKGGIKIGQEDKNQGFWMQELGKRETPLGRREVAWGGYLWQLAIWF